MTKRERGRGKNTPLEWTLRASAEFSLAGKDGARKIKTRKRK
jgi:hypothetical protein